MCNFPSENKTSKVLVRGKNMTCPSFCLRQLIPYDESIISYNNNSNKFELTETFSKKGVKVNMKLSFGNLTIYMLLNYFVIN